MDLSLIIACYNEEKILQSNVDQILEILDITKIDYELIFVDDLSQDNTRNIIDKIIELNPNKSIKKMFIAIFSLISKSSSVEPETKLFCAETIGMLCATR